MVYDDASAGQSTTAAPDSTGTQPVATEYADMDTPRSDRVVVHAAWEIVLAVATAAVVALLYQHDSGVLRGSDLRDLLLSGAVLGLLAVGLSATVRAAVPNLAVGPIAVAAGYLCAQRADQGYLPSAGYAVAAAAGAGLVLALLVVAVRVPAWAASLGAGVLVLAWTTGQHRTYDLHKFLSYDPRPQALLWFGGVAVASVLGGLFCLAPPLRRGLAAYRQNGDPAGRPGGAALRTGLVLILSCVLAAVAGVVSALGTDKFGGVDPGLGLTAFALGAVLLGGVSAFGRRGGTLGTMLAVAMLTVLVKYAHESGWKLSDYAYAAGAILVGTLVTRLVERFGRARTAEEELAEFGVKESSWRKLGGPDGSWSPLPRKSLDDSWQSNTDRGQDLRPAAGTS